MRRKDFTSAERYQLVMFLLKDSQNGRPAKGKVQEAIAKFSSSTRTINRVWVAAMKQINRVWVATMKQREAGEVICLQNTKANNGRPKLVQIDLELISNLELQKRSTIRKLAHGVSCSKCTVGRWIKQGLIKAHTSAIKPDLTAPNKLLRLRFSLEALEVDRILKILRFKSMHNTLHIDEKWFYITKGTHRFYLTPGEEEPHRTCKSKKFITKVMFMCAVCRPIIGPNDNVMFDGKIGIFPFTQKVPAQRASKNRAAGTMETKPIQSVTKEVIRVCLITQILPAIKAKWPTWASKHIYIQQDNAKPHIKDCDPVFRDAARQDGFNFTIVQQPPNSPDTNVNDLGWFRAIQSIQTETACHTIDQLVHAVEGQSTVSPQQLHPMEL